MDSVIMQKLREVLRGAVAALCLAALGIVAWILLSWFALIPVNQINLWLLKRNFVSVPHPPESTLLARTAEFGNFGNSNHCDYLVGEFRSSQLSRAEVQQAYNGVQVRSFNAGTQLPVEIYFAGDLREAAQHDYYWRHWLEKYLPTQKAAVNGHTYFVFTMSAMHPPDGDFRCH